MVCIEIVSMLQSDIPEYGLIADQASYTVSDFPNLKIFGFYFSILAQKSFSM